MDSNTASVIFVLLLIIGIVLLIILPIVFKKVFLIPLIGGTALFIPGLACLLDAKSKLDNGADWIASHLAGTYQTYSDQQNLGIILMVAGGIPLLLGIIFAIKSGSKKKEQNTFVNNYYGAGASPAFPCGNCGSMIPSGTKFCPECGAPVQIPQPAGQRPDVRPYRMAPMPGGPQEAATTQVLAQAAAPDSKLP